MAIYGENSYLGHIFQDIGVTEPTRREACGSICRLLLIDMVTKQAASKTSANRYDTDKAESNPRASVGRRSANNIQ